MCLLEENVATTTSLNPFVDEPTKPTAKTTTITLSHLVDQLVPLSSEQNKINYEEKQVHSTNPFLINDEQPEAVSSSATGVVLIDCRVQYEIKDSSVTSPALSASKQETGEEEEGGEGGEGGGIYDDSEDVEIDVDEIGSGDIRKQKKVGHRASLTASSDEDDDLNRLQNSDYDNLTNLNIANNKQVKRID